MVENPRHDAPAFSFQVNVIGTSFFYPGGGVKLRSGGRTSTVPEGGVGWKGTSEDRNLWYCVEDSQAKKKRARTRKESAETQDFVSPIKHLCEGKCAEIGFKFYDVAVIVTEEGRHTGSIFARCAMTARERSKARKG